MVVSPEILKRLQAKPDLVRNICILAHVDHGKTTLSDSLLASNGIISQNQAGKLRYLDSRPDEQQRGITMESSAVSLYFKVARKPLNDGDKPQVNEYLINLIDSPGHIDFSSEVSTASRLCDGALVLVDVVEGVCSQTVNVLRQAWIEKLKPILVINKMDRLIHELQLTPMEAYTHLLRLVEQVNAIMGSFFAGERMEEDLKWREQQEASADTDEFVEKSDEDIYFSPEKNNVIFASAIDGWGFNVSQFAAIYERKLGIKREKLEKVLWGDFYFDAKTKRVVGPKHKSKNARPLFVQLVLETIWAVYDSTVVNRDADKSAKIVTALNLKINPRDLKAKDGQILLSSIFGQWIPLSVSVLLSVIDKIPSPTSAQSERLPPILDSVIGGKSLKPVVRDAMIHCDRTGPPTAYISKVIAVPEEELLRKQEQDTNLTAIQEKTRKARELASSISQGQSDVVAAGGDEYDINYDDDDFDFEALKAASKKEAAPVREKLIGFARVFSGTLKVGQELYILQPKYDPQFPDKHCEKITITDLYLLMGRDMISLKEVPAGNIIGIGGLDGKILKNGTLVSMKYGGPNLASLSNVTAPIVRVAVEPVDPTKLDQLEQGLRLLNMSDPMVQVMVQENGEHILMTAGELHLERCLKDLRERFAKVEIQSSKPIVPFRESIVVPKEKSLTPRGHGEIRNDHLVVNLRIEPLPKQITDFLNTNALRIEKLVSAKRSNSKEEFLEESTIVDTPEVEISKEEQKDWNHLKSDLTAVYKQAIKPSDGATSDEDNTKFFDNLVNSIVSFGPRRIGPNILTDPNGNLFRKVFSQIPEEKQQGRFPYEESLLTGFQLAMQRGPLCAEPVEGVLCVVESASIVTPEGALDNEKYSGVADSKVSGQLISKTREQIHQAFLEWSPRMLLATYQCDIQATTDVLGKVYGVITRRRGKIVSEEMREGTPFFIIHASIPVVEAFGFSEEIRKKTSGAANPQLVFSGFEVLDEDPFWVPTTEEELEDLGELADKENLAKLYMESVRRRKGLAVHEKVVENAEKQRTMKK